MRSAQNINPWLWMNEYRKQTKYATPPSSEKEKNGETFSSTAQAKGTPCSSFPLKKKEAKEKRDLQVPVLREKKGNVSHRRGNIISIQDPYYYYYYFYYIEARGGRGLYIHKSNRRGNRFLSSIERPLASSILIDDIHST